MTKADDSSLDPEQRSAVEERARQLLHRASAWGVFPTPVTDLVAAAKLAVAPKSLFDPARIAAYLQQKAASTGQFLKAAVSKLLGVLDSDERVIHIDHTLGEPKQKFLTLHETGHHEIPAHRNLFRWFQDCEKTLEPDIADLFEREANNFARFALFQGDAYAKQAADYSFGIKTPMKLAKIFGSSVYASAREYARTNARACAVYILEPIEFEAGVGARASIRRIECSPSFIQTFRCPAETSISLDHPLGPALPINRKMTRGYALQLTDRNGVEHDCLAEAFDTTWNILILLYPVKELTASRIIVPAGYAEIAG